MTTSAAITRSNRTLLEDGLPFRELAQLTQRDRRLTDPVYGAHKWWARRPRSVIRALVLGAHLPAGTDRDTFWRLFNSNEPVLDGAHVGDPFAGGGTTLVESARLGAAVTGTDIDPLAVRIIKSELGMAPPAETDDAGRSLLEGLRRSCGALYPHEHPLEMPLHFLWLRRGECPGCSQTALLHRSLLLARDVGKAGAVRRDHALTAFCPDCLDLHFLPAHRTTLRCCGRRRVLAEGNFTRSGFHCPHCGDRSSLAELKPAVFTDVLLAVETTSPSGYRRLRAPTLREHAAAKVDTASLEEVGGFLPTAMLDGIDGGRPSSYGYERVRDLFTDRQLLVLGRAFVALEEADVASRVKDHLRLAILETVASNNRLCGYAVDYGRLSPAFTGVRSYSLPILFCELNVLHESAGRGTLVSAFRHVSRSSQTSYTRGIWRGGKVEQRRFDSRRQVPVRVDCQTAERSLPNELGRCSAIITDPPYFDYIAYSDLSLLRRSWFGRGHEGSLAGTPIFPSGEDGAFNFSRRLGRSLAAARLALKAEGVLALTYHSSQEAAWRGLAEAVRAASFSVSGVFPVWADGRSGSAHGHDGTCEWDLVWVCRASGEGGELPASVEVWLESLHDFDVGVADIRSLGLGLAAAKSVNAR